MTSDDSFRAIPVQPLAYFDAPDEGWQTTTRLTLIFTAIYAGARLCEGIVYAMMIFGSGSFRFSSTAAVVSILLQALLSMVALVTSLIAMTSRSRGARLVLIVCMIAWVAIGLFIAAAGAVEMSRRGVFGSSPFTCAGYVLNPLMYAVSMAVMPVFIVVILTRPGARRSFGESALD